MRGDRSTMSLTERLTIVHQLPEQKCAAVGCAVHSRQLYRDRRRWSENFEYAIPQAEAWFCKGCHEKRQTASMYCGWCDHTLDSNETFRVYYFRDKAPPKGGGDGEGPLIPICSQCREREPVDFAAAVGEAALYIEQSAPTVLPPPFGPDATRGAISEAELAFDDS